MDSPEPAGFPVEVANPVDLPPLASISRRNSAILGCLALALLVYLLGSFACAMNTAFYVLHAPFFDSCAYDNLLARIITTTRHEGILKAAAIGNSTNYLPWLETAVLTKLFPRVMTVTRTTGVWLQMTWVLPMLLSLFIYFHVIRKLDALMSFAITVTFVCLPVLFTANGGFSDFRMDLALYLFFSLTAVWFLATYDTDQLYPWVLLGISAGLTGLVRATSPVYLVVSLGPPLLVRLILSNDRKRLLIRAAVAAVIAGLVCGWFFILNFQNLRYYYVDWNIDAHTGMSLAQASQHYFFVKDMHLGKPILWFAGTFGAIIFVTQGMGVLERRLRRPLVLLADINWSALWIGVAPVSMLILQRAGLNPFVSMPSCFGILMFLLMFDARPSPAPRPAWLGAGMTVAVLIFLARSALSGVPVHAAQPVGSMEGDMPSHRQVINTVMADAAAKNKTHITFAGSTLMALHSTGVQNVLIFEYGFKPAGGVLVRKPIEFEFDNHFQPAAAVELRDLAPDAETVQIDKSQPPEAIAAAEAKNEAARRAVEEARISKLVDRANAGLDYIVFPDDRTVSFAETEVKRNYANVICRRLRDRVLAGGHWQPLGDPVHMSPNEVEQIYVNRHDAAPAATQP
ncbi:hypothetical protein BH10PLA1_BH10PLA1_04930 [soil metagenome]